MANIDDIWFTQVLYVHIAWCKQCTHNHMLEHVENLMTLVTAMLANAPCELDDSHCVKSTADAFDITLVDD